MNEVLSDWPTLTDTTSHTHARTSNTRPTYTAAPSILLAIVLFWCWSIYITQSRSCDAWRWLAVYGGRQQLTFIKHLTSGPFISISQILLIFATRKRENIGCNFNYLPGFPWYFLIDWFSISTAYADLEGSWNLQSLISPILLEMKKLVIFIFVHFHSYTSRLDPPPPPGKIFWIRACTVLHHLHHVMGVRFSQLHKDPGYNSPRSPSLVVW